MASATVINDLPGKVLDLEWQTAVLDQLNRILKSVTFKRAVSLRKLLQYAVTSTLSTGATTERSTADFLLGRENFDPGVDPSVRVLYGRLRRRIENYYEEEGLQDAIRIRIPERSYTPVIESVVQSVVPIPIAPATNNLGSGSDGGAPRTQAKPSIAVLPFVNLTNDPDQDVFCAGLTDELISALAPMPSVNVVARSSVFQFKDEPVDVRTVGEELGVELILEGSLKKEGEQTRITAQLATVKDGFALWSNSYSQRGHLGQGNLSQAKVASTIVSALPLD
jgi:adenylate cyclase